MTGGVVHIVSSASLPCDMIAFSRQAILRLNYLLPDATTIYGIGMCHIVHNVSIIQS